MEISVADNNKVIVAMSGGVDSSVAAFLLLEQGYEVIGATIDTGYGRAPRQAALLCQQMGIEHHIIPAAEMFHDEIIAPFAKAYLDGLTPNPCVDCNAKMKFPVFWPLMEQLGANKLATGHYCRLYSCDGVFGLRRACAENKDQTYFLCRLGQDILSRCLFPLGDYDKEQIRNIAARQGLASADQKDSFDICFIENGDYRSCVRRYAAGDQKPGDIVDTAGRVVGHHNGLFDYTLGQRKGLNVALGYPAYVVRLDQAANQVVLGPREALMADIAYVRDINMISGHRPDTAFSAEVRIRYQAEPVKTLITPDENGGAELRFSKPVWAPAPGQSAVFYDGDILLGGGYIA